MPHRRTKFFGLLILMAAFLAVVSLTAIKRHYRTFISNEPLLNPPKNTAALPPVTAIGGQASTTPAPSQPKIPGTLSLPVPFTPQAPTGNWDTIHNEACEEASAIMANAYFSGMT